MKIPIEVSARHAHLSLNDLEKLFGRGYRLKKLKNLSQKGEFAACESVKIAGKKASLEIRVLGPTRAKTQIEISATDAYRLGIKAPVRLSGDLNKTPGIKIFGPKGTAKIKKGLIIAQRHVHLNPDQAKKLKLGHRHKINARVDGERGIIFENVIVRVGENFNLSMHIDTDEANAAGLWEAKNFGYLILG